MTTTITTVDVRDGGAGAGAGPAPEDLRAELQALRGRVGQAEKLLHATAELLLCHVRSHAGHVVPGGPGATASGGDAR